MEKKYLVTRDRTLHDRRIVRIYLTPRSWQIREELIKLQQEAARNIDVNFTGEDIRVLEKLKEKSDLEGEWPASE